MTKDREQKWVALFGVVAILVLLLIAKGFSTITYQGRFYAPYDMTVWYRVTDTSGGVVGSGGPTVVSKGALFSPNINIDETRNNVIHFFGDRGYDTISWEVSYNSAQEQSARVGRRVWWHYNKSVDSVIVYADSLFATSNRIFGDTIRPTDGDAAGDSLANRGLFVLPRIPGQTQARILVNTFFSSGVRHTTEIPYFPGADTSTSGGGGTSPWTTTLIDSLFALADSNRALAEIRAAAGNDTLRVYAVDTSGTDEAVEGVYIALYNSANPNTPAADGYTNSGGYKDFTVVLDSSNYYYYTGNGPGRFYWPGRDSVLHVAVTPYSVDTIHGFDLPLSIASASNVAAVTVAAKYNNGSPASGVWVSAYPSNRGIVDSAGYAVSTQVQHAQTDSMGLATFYCLWSSYMIPATEWVFSGRYQSFGGFKVVATIPRQTSYFLNLSSQ